MTEHALLWEYKQTALEEQNATGRQQVTDHMNEIATAGWELVSASAVFAFAIDTTQAQGAQTYQPLGWGVVRSNGAFYHHFYWRRPAS